MLRRKDDNPMSYENPKAPNNPKKSQVTKQLAFAIITLIKSLINVIDHLTNDK